MAERSGARAMGPTPVPVLELDAEKIRQQTTLTVLLGEQILAHARELSQRLTGQLGAVPQERIGLPGAEEQRRWHVHSQP